MQGKNRQKLKAFPEIKTSKLFKDNHKKKLPT